MPSKFQSAGLTSINTFFRSIFLSSVPGPNLFTMAYVSSTEHYVSVYASGFIKSLILCFKRVDKWQMVVQPPSFIVTMPKPEHWRLGNGGALNGPSIRHLLHSDRRALSKIEGFVKEDCKLWAGVTNFAPLFKVC